jgi:hypothetical protein
MRRALAPLAVWVATLALLAPAALANDHGQGLYGETNDKVVTNAGFILIAFFPALVLVLSLLQGRLDKRKKARLAAQKARAVRQRNGW